MPDLLYILYALTPQGTDNTTYHGPCSGIARHSGTHGQETARDPQTNSLLSKRNTLMGWRVSYKKIDATFAKNDSFLGYFDVILPNLWVVRQYAELRRFQKFSGAFGWGPPEPMGPFDIVHPYYLAWL